MRKYELVIALRPALEEKAKQKIFDDMASWLGDSKIVENESLGNKVLKYEIKHEINGIYHKLRLEGENVIPADFEKRLLLTDEILRHLLIKLN